MSRLKNETRRPSTANIAAGGAHQPAMPVMRNRGPNGRAASSSLTPTQKTAGGRTAERAACRAQTCSHRARLNFAA